MCGIRHAVDGLPHEAFFADCCRVSSTSSAALKDLLEDIARHEVECEEQERHNVSEGNENITAEKTSGQDEEEDHERQHATERALFICLWVTRIGTTMLSARRLIARAKYVVPREIQHE